MSKKVTRLRSLKKQVMGQRAMEFMAQYFEMIQESIDEGSGYVRDQINRILQKLELTTQIQYPADIQIHHQLKVPVKEKFVVPVAASVRLDTVVHSSLEVPLEINLTEADLSIDGMSIAVDQKVTIQDELELNVKDLLDSLVDLDKVWVDRLRQSLPLKKTAKLKINQPVRITGTLTPQIRQLNLKLKKNVLLNLAVPINQDVNVQGMATVNINQEISAPIHTALPVNLDQPVKVKVMGLQLRRD